jgi:phospholipid/cholesterol/gamma-HCH transport system permease protein
MQLTEGADRSHRLRRVATSGAAASGKAKAGLEEQMVGSAVNRAFLPAKSVFEQVGELVLLTGRTIASAVRPPYPYGEEFIGQFLFALQLCWFPLLISTVAINFGAPGLQAANFLTLFGALDRLGGFSC